MFHATELVIHWTKIEGEGKQKSRAKTERSSWGYHDWLAPVHQPAVRISSNSGLRWCAVSWMRASHENASYQPCRSERQTYENEWGELKGRSILSTCFCHLHASCLIFCLSDASLVHTQREVQEWPWAVIVFLLTPVSLPFSLLLFSLSVPF